MAGVAPLDLLPLLGTMMTPEVYDEDLPIGLQCSWWPTEHLREEGQRTHALPSGWYPSPYPNDDGFGLFIGYGGHILRWSEYTHDVCVQWGDISMSTLKAFDSDHHVEWNLIEHGLAPSIMQFSNAWLENRSEVSGNDSDNVRPLSSGCAAVIAPLVIAFSHEAEPWWVRNFLEMACRWKPPRRRNAPRRSFGSFSWGHVLEATAVKFFTRYRMFHGFSSSYGIRGPAFTKVVSYLVAEYVKKRYPRVSFRYTMENDSPCHKESIGSCIGLAFP